MKLDKFGQELYEKAFKGLSKLNENAKNEGHIINDENGYFFMSGFFSGYIEKLEENKEDLNKRIRKLEEEKEEIEKNKNKEKKK